MNFKLKPYKNENSKSGTKIKEIKFTEDTFYKDVYCFYKGNSLSRPCSGL